MSGHQTEKTPDGWWLGRDGSTLYRMGDEVWFGHDPDGWYCGAGLPFPTREEAVAWCNGPRNRREPEPGESIADALLRFGLTEAKGPAIVTHPDGGKHRPCAGDLTLFPPESILAASVVLERGAAEYGVDNWRKLPLREHLRHALAHVYLWLSGNRDEPHLTHAMLRLSFAAALEMAKMKEPKP